MSAELDWTPAGARSSRYGDIYFSPDDGLAESRAVFLAGCGLPQAWAGRERFTVAELGFGSGLNVLALLQLWAVHRPAGGRLHVFSVEAHPLAPADAARMLAPWPELAALAAPLLARWPQARGVTRVDWPALGATLDVAIGEAGEALAGWDGDADAWFLDGFSPATNPEMWRPALLELVAARSAPGARLATFTVAGAFRRGLKDAGFDLAKRPGFGRKRERLEAELVRPPAPKPATWSSRPAATPGPVAVIGGGIAAAALVRALRREGSAVVRIDDGAGGASHGPGVLVVPRLERAASPAARLYAQAWRRGVALYTDEAADAVTARGVRVRDERDPAALISPGLYDPDDIAPTPSGFVMPRALALDPSRLVARWLGGAPCVRGRAAALERTGEGWRVLDGEGRLLVEAAHVIVAAGQGTRALLDVPLQAVRGQASLAPGLTGPALSGGGYVAPGPAGLTFGATHDLDDEGADVRGNDHRRNLATLAALSPALAGCATATPLAGWAAVRAATPDRLPLAGPVAERAGLWVLSGLGSRGFTTAPLLAEHLAAWIAGAPSPLPLDLAAAIHPGRFAERVRRRSGSPAGALSSSTNNREQQP